MKQIFRILPFLCLGLLMSCAEEQIADEQWQEKNGNPAHLIINVAPFSTNNGTRAVDEGMTTVFEEGDAIGLIVVDGSNEVNSSANNLRCEYHDGNWVLPEGKKLNYEMDSKYIAYFPYQASMNGKKSIEEIVTAFDLPVDQSETEKYRSADLLAAEGVWDGSLASVCFDMHHCFSLLVVNEIQKVGLTYNGEAFGGTEEKVIEASVTLNEKLYKAWKDKENNFRVMVPHGEQRFKMILSTESDKNYKLTENVMQLQPNFYYVRHSIGLGEYAESGMVREGDFFCMNEVGGWYLIPKEATPVQSEKCIGIVFYQGSRAFDEDPKLKEKYPSCKNGLVMSLNYIAGTGKSKWSTKNIDITNNWIPGGSWEGILDLKEQKMMQGFSNTLALDNYNDEVPDAGMEIIDAIKQYRIDYSVPSGCSGWYLPSACELLYACTGTKPSGTSTMRDIIDIQLGKIGEAPLTKDRTWTSTETKAVGAMPINISSCKEDFRSKGESFLTRPILAF